MAAVSGNLSANLLGLGNAATPLGIRAARRMALGAEGTASNELCRLVVLNTASVQLLPTTVAAVRAGCGAAAPFDILPAVWISSLLSVSVGLLTARLWSGWCDDGPCAAKRLPDPPAAGRGGNICPGAPGWWIFSALTTGAEGGPAHCAADPAAAGGPADSGVYAPSQRGAGDDDPGADPGAGVFGHPCRRR